MAKVEKMAPSKNGTSSAEMARPPAGFQRQGSVSGAPWFKLQSGAVLTGRLLGKSERKDPKSPSGVSYFFQVESSEACEATKGKGVDAELIDVAKGDVVNLNYTKKTAEALDPFVPQILAGAEIDVWVVVKAKLTTQSGNSFWDMDVFAKIVTPAKMRDSVEGFEDENTTDDAE